MTWDRVSRWDIEERTGCVVLTLRGDGAVTPLVVTGWTLDDLETVMRRREADVRARPPGRRRPARGGAAERGHRRRRCRRRRCPSPPTPPATPWRAWKPVVTVVLLGVLATAVALVLLQSAGIISWGFLGPTA